MKTPHLIEYGLKIQSNGTQYNIFKFPVFKSALFNLYGLIQISFFEVLHDLVASLA